MFYAISLVTHVAQYDPNWLHVMSFRLLESLTLGYAVVKFMEKKWRELLKCCFCNPPPLFLNFTASFFRTSSLFSSSSSSSSPSLCSLSLTTKTSIHIFYTLFQQEPRRPTSSGYYHLLWSNIATASSLEEKITLVHHLWGGVVCHHQVYYRCLSGK